MSAASYSHNYWTNAREQSPSHEGTGPVPIMKFPTFFAKLKGSFFHSQLPPTSQCLEPDESRWCHPIFCFKITFDIILLSMCRFSKWSVPNENQLIYTISQQMHYSDSLLITFYSCYMFRHVYVIIIITHWLTNKKYMNPTRYMRLAM
jgi:hypothetical protein